ncbi:hypothetical protein D3C78_1448400 [compost metagenome]
MTLNKVVTDVMGVSKLKGDDFEKRFELAFRVFNNIEGTIDSLTIEEYKKVKNIIDGLVIEETNDPVYKAFLKAKSKLDETNS